MTNQEWEVFVAGMAYAAGPQKTREIMDDDPELIKRFNFTLGRTIRERIDYTGLSYFDRNRKVSK